MTLSAIKLILRKLLRNKLNTSVIIVSLAVGIACVNLIVTFIYRELNTDGFNTDKSRIYAMLCNEPTETSRKNFYCLYGSVEYVKDNFPEVEDYCRINGTVPKKFVINNQAYFDRNVVVTASSNFFDFFKYNILSRSSQGVLNTEHDIVISQELAGKYFGTDFPIGKAIKLLDGAKEKTYFVTGVFSKPINNSQINADMVTLIGETYSRCYLRLNSTIIEKQLEEKLAEHKDEIPNMMLDKPNPYYLESMHSAYFSLERDNCFEKTRNETDLWIASIIGLMILGIAVFNYLTLLGIKFSDRAKELSIRKIQGCSNKNLTGLLTLENVLIIFISYIISFPIMIHITPFFNSIVGTQIVQIYFGYLNIIGLSAVIPVFIIFITYFHTAFKLRSRIRNNKIELKDNISHQKKIPVFNIIQVAVVVVLIICSTIILKQINFISNKQIGLNKNVIEIKIPEIYKEKTAVFKQELEKFPCISELAIATASPVLEHAKILMDYEENGKALDYGACGFFGDANFSNTLDIKIIKGENFTGNPDTDSRKCLINQSLASLFPERNLIGSELPGLNGKTVIGIVQDFHFLNLKTLIEPGFIEFNQKGSHILVKPVEGKENKAYEVISAVWKKLIPDYALDYQTIGSRYESLHAENQNFIKLIGSCCLISIFLAMIGLLAVSSYNCNRRVKEIGIRKVNGAKIHEVLILLNTEYAIWVVIAFVLAFPVAYYFTNKWLENFAYKTTLSWWVFALAGILALGIALLTVSWQTWRAARKNPVEALRYD